jgi:hypothetical protein
VEAPSVQEVERIGAIASPAVRNLEITYCYSRLAAAAAERMGTGANWCTFATWASRQAGRTIRGEDLAGQLEWRLHAGPELMHPLTSLWRVLLRRGLLNPGTPLGRLTARLHTPFDAFELTSEAVARGNKKVFDEIGLQFARYLHDVPPDAAPDSPPMLAFLDGLHPDLRQAFLHYQRHGHANDPQLLFLANLEIGLHEQERLQPEIRAALDAPEKTAESLLGRLLPGPQRVASELAREVITAALMVLSLPGRVLALGTHLRDPFPEALRDPSERELVALLARFEPVAPAPDDCGAHDWSDLRQRMHYIVHLFRAFHVTADLAGPPFTPAQVEQILAGAIPDGEL